MAARPAVRAPLARLLAGAALVGLADLGAAALINGVPYTAVTRVVAAGLIGAAAARAGGGAIVLLGLVLQVSMAMIIGLIVWLALPRLPGLARHRLAAGLAYGVGIFLVMNYVVLPLSALGRFPHFLGPAHAAAHLATMLAFGLAMLWLATARR